MTEVQMQAVARATLRHLGYSFEEANKMASKIAEQAKNNPMYVLAPDQEEELYKMTLRYVGK